MGFRREAVSHAQSSFLTEVGSGFEIHQWNIELEGYCLFEIPMTPVLLFPEEKLYCSKWSKILTGFPSQKESA